MSHGEEEKNDNLELRNKSTVNTSNSANDVFNENILQHHINMAVKEYMSGNHYDTLIEANNLYFSVTGQLNEDDDDYEARMNSFNDWYILQFVSKRNTRTVIKDYLTKYHVDDRLAKSLLNVNNSLFLYDGDSFGGKVILKDILHDKKIVLPKDHPRPAIVKDDIFLGRTLHLDDMSYLLSGVCILPKVVKSILTKQSKKIRKMKDPKKEADFLLKVEFLKTKWKRYGHIEASKIFVFEE